MLIKKQPFLIFSTLISSAIILLFVYQNCGQLGANSGANIFTECTFSSCNNGNPANLKITSTNIQGSSLVVPVLSNAGTQFPLTNINISGTCNTGGYPHVLVRGTISGPCVTSTGTSCTFLSACSPTTGTFSLQGYANLNSTAAPNTYFMNIEIAAQNQYLQDITGPNSFLSPYPINVISASPPLLASLGCTAGENLSTCLSQGSWKVPTNSPIASSAVIFTGSNGSVKMDGNLTGYCTYSNSGATQVSVYIVPYGADYTKFPAIATVPCNYNTAVPSGYSGVFQVASASVLLDGGISTVGGNPWCLASDAVCNASPFGKSGERIAQVVVTEVVPLYNSVTHQTQNIPLSTTRNAYFRFSDPVFGNNWDINILHEVVNRITKAFYVNSGLPPIYSASAADPLLNSVYNRGVALTGSPGCQSTCSSGPVYCPASSPSIFGSTCAYYESNGCFGAKSTYYAGIRQWLTDSILGNVESIVGASCPTSSSGSGAAVPVTMAGNNDYMQYANIAGGTTCDIFNSNATPILVGSSSIGDDQSARIAACLTSRYLNGIWSASYSTYAQKFASEGIKCTDVSCSSCTFQVSTSAGIQNTTGSQNDCALMVKFYNAISAQKAHFYPSGTIAQDSNYPSFYSAVTQLYLNRIMRDFNNMSAGKSTSPLFKSIFNAVYPNITSITNGSLDSLVPNELNYCINPGDDCSDTVPFGAIYDPTGVNNYPSGSIFGSQTF